MLLAAWIAVNLVCFALMGIDKRRAVRGRRRIPERTLFLWAALFGALGGMIGMQVFRHKTKHRSFCIGFPALLTVQAALILIICGLWR